ncbi:hypothetical protein [secondary endosymbiont of Heteropsylla cubana]|nr:hypothetical protein [secondary endosymbiont of Heteropsylla cubana]
MKCVCRLLLIRLERNPLILVGIKYNDRLDQALIRGCLDHSTAEEALVFL